MRRLVIVAAALILGGYGIVLLAGIGQANAPQQRLASGYDTVVDENGVIRLPKADFRRDWTMLGAWVVSEEGRSKGLHNVYAEQSVVEHYRRSGEFPDGAIIIKELLSAATGDYTTGQVSFANETEGWFVMVKDRQGRFKDNPIWGKGWGWAYFAASNPGILVTKNYEEECLTCHVPAERTDWIYTEAYPVLGNKAKDNERFAAIVADMAANPSGPDTSHSAAQVMEVAELVRQGERVFKRCKACHTVEVGQNRSGPSLAGVFGRPAGTLEGFRFSEAMRNSGVVWNDETLDKHLADVPNFIPGNRMGKVFRSGVPKPEDRKAVIEFLKSN